MRCKTLIAPLSYLSSLPTLLTALSPLLLGDRGGVRAKNGKVHISIFLYKLIKGTNSGDLMQLKPQDSVSCVLTIFTSQQGKACPYFRPFFLHWVMVGSSSGCPPALSCVFMDVHGRPSMGVPGVHGCPYKRQPLAARCIASLYLSAGRPGQQLLLVG